MPAERESLKFVDYDIMGHVFRAWFDDDGNPLFVVDSSVAEYKPNVLLVINDQNGRKWDDILVNDYGVDLEDVRPKKNNKYQKLDIEYRGLNAYENLIQAYEDDENISAQLAELMEFKLGAAYRNATERLADAEATAQKARATIEKTNETIDELGDKVKTLRAKLANQRKAVGKEPTKQSAAKILRTESLIDATNEKLKRARKRLANAQNRLTAAMDDADVAQKILEYVQNHNDGMGGGALPAMPVVTDVAPVVDAPAPMIQDEQPNEIIPYTPEETEEKAEDMADEEVKPLFDKDPEILDEELAFQPISFEMPKVEPVAAPAPVTESAPIAEPIAVAPVVDEVPNARDDFEPIAFQPIAQENAREQEERTMEPVVAPVLDSIVPVSEPTQAVAQEHETREYEQPFVPTPIEMPMADVQPAPAPMPEISPAPIDSGMRPVSPITGEAVENTAPVMPAPTARRPNVLYYGLLLVLIVLSIFTLWVYQGTTNDKAPELGATTSSVVEVEEEQTEDVLFDPETPAVQPQPVEIQVVEPVPLPEPQPIIQVEPLPEPVAVEETPEVIVEEAEEVEESEPLVEAVTTVATFEPEPVIVPTEEEVIATKPSYNVSQQEKMFIADEEYETDAPQVISEDVVTEEVESCAGGASPDADGCCPGETLMYADDGSVACCAFDTGECFPPMF